MTEADVLVASPEFQNLSAEVSVFSKEIKNNYVKLSKKQRREFLKINKEIRKGKASGAELKALWDQLSSIISIDYQLRTDKITVLATMVFQKHNVSTRQFLIAMEKRDIKNNTSISRLKTRAESEDAYQDCLKGCDMKYIADLEACYEKHGRGDDSPERNTCVMDAGAYLNDCNAECLSLIPVQ